MKGTKRLISPGLKRDRRALEGLPLKLLIVVIIAVTAIGIIMVWMGQIGGPKAIGKIIVEPSTVSLGESDPDVIATGTVTFNITVFDVAGNRMPGVSITLDGCNATKKMFETDKNGEVSITTSIQLPGGQNTGIIKVKAWKSGYGEKETEILVNRY